MFNKVFFSSKKGVSDIISFLLIIFLSIVVTTAVYYYVDSRFQTQIGNQEFAKVENQLVYTQNVLDYIKQNPSRSQQVIISFAVGRLEFTNESIRYIGDVASNSTGVSCATLCYEPYNDLRSTFINLSSFNTTLDMSQNLTSGSYILYLAYDTQNDEFRGFIE
ncbi:MAG: hypothetical protein ACLFPL_04540 [Candidatus Nanoarchaeia archaeon]